MTGFVFHGHICNNIKFNVLMYIQNAHVNYIIIIEVNLK